MLSVATGGMIGNAVMAFILSKGHHDLNIKSAWLHIIGDLLASFGVVVAGVIIYYTGFRLADPIAGVLVGLLVLGSGVRVVKEATWVFLELVPSGYDVEEISKALLEIPDVQGLHDLHLWSISHGMAAFSAHIWVHDQTLSSADRIRTAVEKKLETFGIHHSVIQMECAECEKNGLYCQIQSGDLHHHH
jgi:cobalt-zinc-cadmium efflux system protein